MEGPLFQAVVNILAGVGVLAVLASVVFLLGALWVSARESRREENREALGEMPDGWRHREGRAGSLPEPQGGRDRARR